MLGLLGQLVVQISRKQQPDDITAALERIDGVLHAGPAASADRSLLERVTLDRSILSVLTEYEEYRLKENIRARKNLFLLKATFDIADFEKGIKQLSVPQKIRRAYLHASDGRRVRIRHRFHDGRGHG